MEYQDKQKEFKGIDPFLSKPEKVKSISIKYPDGKVFTMQDVKETFIKMDVRKDYAFGGIYNKPVLCFQEVFLVLSTKSFGMWSVKALDNAEVTFQLENKLSQQITVSEKFLPFTYEIGEITVKTLIDGIDRFTFMSNDELSEVVFKLKLNIDRSFYTFNLETKPVNFTRYSVDGAEKIIIEEPYVIYLIKKDGNYVKGVAKCNPCDRFDVKKGIEIARLRAEMKLLDVKLGKLTK